MFLVTSPSILCAFRGCVRVSLCVCICGCVCVFDPWHVDSLVVNITEFHKPKTKEFVKEEEEGL